MCEKCGCSAPTLRQHGHTLAHTHAATRAHVHEPEAAELSRQDRLAERNRGFFLAKRVFVVNLLSFAGSGAPSFVVRTVAEYGLRRKLRVVTSDFLDQIHAHHDHQDHDGHAHADTPAPDENASLDAHGIAHALDHLELDTAEIVLLENGGSAAAQAVYDLGETVRVAMFSFANGESKPLKFPFLFKDASAVVINETAPAAGSGFDRIKARANLAQVAPDAQILEVASSTGAGMDAWYAFLEKGLIQTQS
ncbi:MAG: hydrogenase nickel incorporation protein HypB [Kiritimatiellia bacterium]